MKKVLVLFTLVGAISCSNPEDNATGNPDSTSFNQNEKNNTNASGPGMEGSTDPKSASIDTSAAPALQKENANSRTEGTNRVNPKSKDSAR